MALPYLELLSAVNSGSSVQVSAAVHPYLELNGLAVAAVKSGARITALNADRLSGLEVAGLATTAKSQITFSE